MKVIKHFKQLFKEGFTENGLNIKAKVTLVDRDLSIYSFPSLFVILVFAVKLFIGCKIGNNDN
jgi:hypothetical protein